MYRANEKRTGIYQTKGVRNLNSWQNYSLRQPPHSDISMFKTEEKISFIIPHNKGEPGDLNNRLILFYIFLFIAALICSPISTSGELSFANQMIIRVVLAIPLAITKCLIVEGTKYNKFGRYIKRFEKEWLIEEINSFIAQLSDH